MKFNKFMAVAALSLALAGTTSCVGDLDQTPTDPNNKLEISTADEWNGYFARLYAGLVLSGNVTVSDGGAGVYTRVMWNLNEITADEAFICDKWNDPGYTVLNYATWSNNNEWIYAAYTRCMFQIRMCTEFISRFEGVSIDGISDAESRAMIAEATVLRDLSYYHLIDWFGRGPWITTADPVGTVPAAIERKELFDNTVAELKDVIASGNLKPAAGQVYGRLSLEAARMLLAKLYLNAEVYTGTAMWADCAAQCQEIVKTINTLVPDYRFLFCASNRKYVGNGEIIWGIPQDATEIQTYGGTTYLTAGAYREGCDEADPDLLSRLGCTATPWSGLLVRPELSRALSVNDARRLIFEGTYKEGIQDVSGVGATCGGYMGIKYTYTDESDYYNTAKHENTNQFCSADYPMFRLADTYLMLAECQLHGVECNGLQYFNDVRTRANMPTVSNYNENDLLKERQCELWWEGHRRQDLIRFGRYTGDRYLWSWKGGIYEGQNIEAYRSVFPIPYQYVQTVGQNPGY